MSNPFKRLAKRLSLEDYKLAREQGGLVASARFARGNVMHQLPALQLGENNQNLRVVSARAKRRIFG